MIKKFTDKPFGKSYSAESGSKRVKKAPFGKRHDSEVKDHGINPKLVDERAMDVVHTLKRAGVQAYIGGGAVREGGRYLDPGSGEGGGGARQFDRRRRVGARTVGGGSDGGADRPAMPLAEISIVAAAASRAQLAR